MKLAEALFAVFSLSFAAGCGGRIEGQPVDSADGGADVTDTGTDDGSDTRPVVDAPPQCLLNDRIALCGTTDCASTCSSSDCVRYGLEQGPASAESPFGTCGVPTTTDFGYCGPCDSTTSYCVGDAKEPFFYQYCVSKDLCQLLEARSFAGACRYTDTSLLHANDVIPALRRFAGCAA